MKDKLTREEVATLIRARKIANAKELDKGADVKTICEAAGISRKTGYQWAEKLTKAPDDSNAEKLARLQTAHEQLEKKYEWVSFENEGRKLAWEIHGVDELLEAKKNTTARSKKKKR